jgi:preprotein translocase subunit SecE
MATKSETGSSSVGDTVLLLLSVIILIGGIVGFYYFENQAITVVRSVGLLLTVGVAMFIARFTEKGMSLFRFFKEADIERRKVVWPTRAETVQTAIMVIIVTIIVSIMLFIIDSILGWIVRLLLA